MVKVREDLTGKVFGRLTVIKQADDYVNPSGVHFAQWLCECSCEEHNQVVVATSSLKRSKSTKSCGCINKEVLSLRKKYNNVKLNLNDEHGAYGIGYCSNTGNEFYFDMTDYEKIKTYTWREDVDHYGYPRLRATIGGKEIKMHTFLGYSKCDHEDRNPFNNRRYNLRAATQSENATNQGIQSNNTSGFIGVSWNKSTNKWRSYINEDKKFIYLGEYVDKTSAITARLQAEKKFYGDFAPQRHLFKQYGIL